MNLTAVKEFFQKKSTWIGLAVIALLVVSCSAFAQPKNVLLISTGTEAGSYHKFMVQAQSACSQIPMKLVIAPNGTTETVSRLEQNEASMGLVQIDALELYKNNRDMSNIKVVTPLFKEQVHFVARAESGIKEGGYGFGKFKAGAKEVVMNTVEDLSGRNVAAAGGAFITAQQFRLLSNLMFNLIDEKGGADAVLNGVISGQYDVGILVGAQPVGNFAKLGANQAKLKLLPVTAELAAKVAAVYGKSYPLTYRDMTNSSAVQGIEVNSALVTQNYKFGSTMANNVVQLRTCIKNAADDMAQTAGNHPAWRSVAKGDIKTSWPLYEGSIAFSAPAQGQVEAPAEAAPQPQKQPVVKKK